MSALDEAIRDLRVTDPDLAADAAGDLARLRKALRDFGVHRTDCRSRGLITGRDRACTCGLAAAKEETT